MFMKMLKEMLIDCRWQNWESHIDESNRYTMYRSFTSIPHSKQLYLSLGLDRQIRNIVTKFRFGISDLHVHYYRYRIHTASDLSCPMCGAANEDEIHFVLCCPGLSSLRDDYFSKYFRNPCLSRLILLMAFQNVSTIKNFALFLYKGFKL